MRIFLAGDHLTGTGPSNVTQYYIDNLPSDTLYQKQTSKILRVPEIVINTIKSDVVLYSGYSKQNILGMTLAKLLHKPKAYLMHGCVEYENEINNEVDEEMVRVDRKTLELADVVLAVSPSFASWLREYYPEYADKIDYVSNGINREEFASSAEIKGIAKAPHMIVSIGGGMPRKKIKHICEAITKLQDKYDNELKLVVIGANGDDTDEINKYPFVDNRGLVSRGKASDILNEATVFVQNSCFETFGLAPLEALSAGCSLLLSSAVGALCVFSNIRAEDIISNCEDAGEIADKLDNILENSNAVRLAEGIDWEKESWKTKSLLLQEKLQKLMK